MLTLQTLSRNVCKRVKTHLSRWVTTWNSSSTYPRSFEMIDNIPQSKLDEFHTNGWCVIDEFLTESEVCYLEDTFDRFMRGEMDVPGKDFCDMSREDGYFTPLENMRIVNAMLPTKYYPIWKNNIYEAKTRALIKRLYPQEFEMEIDYDQLLGKRPHEKEAMFAFHQDGAYWPDLNGRNDATCTISLALDSTSLENGCIAFLPQSHLEGQFRAHEPLSQLPGRDGIHTMQIILNDREKNELEYALVPRGGISLHDEKIVHGSMGNKTDGWRRTYIIAYRAKETIKYERSIGFTHSHNDVDQLVTR